MRCIHIRLTEKEWVAARQEAARLGISLPQFFRWSLRNLLPVDTSKPWMRYAGMVETGDLNSSRHIDDLV